MESADNILQASAWHNVVLTYENESIKLYVDGQVVASNNETIDVTPTGLLENFVVGSNMTGCVDEIQFYDKVLTSEEVGHIAYEGNYSAALANYDLKFNELTVEPTQVIDSKTGASYTTTNANYEEGFVDGSKSIRFTDGGDVSLGNVDLSQKNAVSISTWVNLDTLTNTGQTIVKKDGVIDMSIDNDDIKLTLGSTPISFTLANPTAPMLNDEKFSFSDPTTAFDGSRVESYKSSAPQGSVSARFWRLVNMEKPSTATVNMWEFVEAHLYDVKKTQLTNSSTVMSSSSTGWETPLTEVVDGLSSTRVYISNVNTEGSYLQWDLGSPHTVSYFQFQNNAVDGANGDYTIAGGQFQYSDDGINFTNLPEWSIQNTGYGVSYSWSEYAIVQSLTPLKSIGMEGNSTIDTTNISTPPVNPFPYVYEFEISAVSWAIANNHSYLETQIPVSASGISSDNFFVKHSNRNNNVINSTYTYTVSKPRQSTVGTKVITIFSVTRLTSITLGTIQRQLYAPGYKIYENGFVVYEDTTHPGSSSNYFTGSYSWTNVATAAPSKNYTAPMFYRSNDASDTKPAFIETGISTTSGFDISLVVKLESFKTNYPYVLYSDGWGSKNKGSWAFSLTSANRLQFDICPAESSNKYFNINAQTTLTSAGYINIRIVFNKFEGYFEINGVKTNIVDTSTKHGNLVLTYLQTVGNSFETGKIHIGEANSFDGYIGDINIKLDGYYENIVVDTVPTFYTNQMTISSWVKTSNTSKQNIISVGENVHVGLNNNAIECDIDQLTGLATTTIGVSSFNIENSNYSGDIFNSVGNGTDSIDFDVASPNSLVTYKLKRFTFGVPFRNYAPTSVSIVGVNGSTETTLVTQPVTFKNSNHVYDIVLDDTNAAIDNNKIKVKFNGSGAIKVKDVGVESVVEDSITTNITSDAKTVTISGNVSRPGTLKVHSTEGSPIVYDAIYNFSSGIPYAFTVTEATYDATEQAASFDKTGTTSSRMTVDASSILTSNFFTVSFDVKFNELSSSNTEYWWGLGNVASNTYADYIRLWYNHPNLRVQMGSKEAYGAVTLPTKEYVRMTIINADTAPYQRVYINGVKVNFTSDTDGELKNAFANKTMYFGNANGHNFSETNTTLNGFIKNIKIFDRVLSDADVTASVNHENTIVRTTNNLVASTTIGAFTTHPTNSTVTMRCTGHDSTIHTDNQICMAELEFFNGTTKVSYTIDSHWSGLVTYVYDGGHNTNTSPSTSTIQSYLSDGNFDATKFVGTPAHSRANETGFNEDWFTITVSGEFTHYIFTPSHVSQGANFEATLSDGTVVPGQAVGDTTFSVTFEDTRDPGIYDYYLSVENGADIMNFDGLNLSAELKPLISIEEFTSTQTYTIPEGTTTIKLVMWGAGGNGSIGGYSEGVINCTGGDQLYLVVGTYSGSGNSSSGWGWGQGGGLTGVFDATGVSNFEDRNQLHANSIVIAGAGAGTNGGG